MLSACFSTAKQNVTNNFNATSNELPADLNIKVTRLITPTLEGAGSNIPVYKCVLCSRDAIMYGEIEQPKMGFVKRDPMYKVMSFIYEHAMGCQLTKDARVNILKVATGRPTYNY